MAKNIYGEMFEQLPIPERLEPDNIAKMLDEHMAASTKRSAITVSSSDNNTIKTAPKKTRSATYRAIMSVAACAVLVLGLVRYTGVDQPKAVVQPPAPGNYASDYSDVHKTFQKYYVDDSDKETLDSAIAEIEHAYNEAQGDQATDEVAKDPVVTDAPDVTEAPESETEATTTEPVTDPADIPHEEEVEEINDNAAVLPDMTQLGEDQGIVVNGSKVFIRSGNDIRVLSSENGALAYTCTVEMQAGVNETKSLVDFYVIGNRIAVVYAVETAEPVTVSQPAEDVTSDSVLDEILDDTFTEVTTNVVRRSTEVCVYEFVDGIAYLAYSGSQCGSFVEAKEIDGNIYVVTNYNDYRLSPIVGVDDLDSYVPTYTVNGEKRYIEASSILIPSNVTNTDYTVILGITADKANIEVCAQALLGYEDRMLVTDEGVYIFSYEAGEVSSTSVEKFAFVDGAVVHDGFIVIDGVALGGDGISYTNGAILIATLAENETGFVTSLRAYDEALEIISKVDFPELLTQVERDGSKIYLNGHDTAYGVDFADPAIPTLIEPTGEKDILECLVKFEDGYVTLTETEDGSIVLNKIIEDASGNLSNCYSINVYTGDGATSKALTNNDILYVSGDLVGVPYGYFDGYDYCYTYALYRSVGNAFELVGTFESHETDSIFEMGKAVSQDGLLYVFSEGRVYVLSATAEALAPVGRADMVYSTYSGHNIW